MAIGRAMVEDEQQAGRDGFLSNPTLGITADLTDASPGSLTTFAPARISHIDSAALWKYCGCANGRANQVRQSSDRPLGIAISAAQCRIHDPASRAPRTAKAK